MSPVYFHLGLMTAALVSMLSAILIARFFKTKKWWLKAHKALNLASVGLGVAGFGVAFAMVEASGGPHFRVPHAIAGGIALVFALALPALGFSIFRAKTKEKVVGLKKAHRRLGMLAALLMGVTAIAGYSLAGIL